MVDRRGFLKGSAAAVAGALGAAELAGCAPMPSEVTPRGPGGEAGIDHIVVLMMENRSFDHFLGWLPGAEGRQGGHSFPDADGVLQPTHHLKEFASCDFADPDHSFRGGRVQFNDGACDGFVAKSPDLFPIGYYEQADLPFWGGAAPAWTVCDHYHAAIMGPTFPNRFYLHAAQTDRWENWFTVSSLPTIWDRLLDASMQARYYFSDAPFTALWGAKYLGISRPIDGFFADCAAGRLPHVAYVDPRFLFPPFGNSEDYHPPSDIRLGERFVNSVYDAVVTGPNWERTVLVINFDEWGGFYDHVPPEEAPDLNPAFGLRGFRVPCLVASPFARRGHVAHDVYDHASVVKMIEWAFDLEALGPRDAAANNLAEVLDLTSPPNPDAPRFDVPVEVAAPDCTAAFFGGLWSRLLEQATGFGFPS